MPNHCTISQPAFKAALDKVIRITGGRATLPILNCVRLEAANGILSLAASDLDVFATSKCECEGILEPVCVSAKMLASLVAPSAQPIKLTVEGGKLIVEGGGKAKLPYLTAEEFPPFPKRGKAIGVNVEDLARLIKDVAWAHSTDESRYNLRGTFVKMSEKEIVCCATNGAYLALQQFPAIAAPCEFIIPEESVSLICEALNEKEAIMFLSDRCITAGNDSFMVSSKLIDSTYPNFWPVIKDAEVDIVKLGRCSKEPFADALATIAQLGIDDKAGFCSCFLNFSRKGVRFDYQSENCYDTTIDAKFSTEKEIKVQTNNLLKIVRSVPADEFEVQLGLNNIKFIAGSYLTICMLLKNDREK